MTFLNRRHIILKQSNSSDSTAHSILFLPAFCIYSFKQKWKLVITCPYQLIPANGQQKLYNKPQLDWILFLFIAFWLHTRSIYQIIWKFILVSTFLEYTLKGKYSGGVTIPPPQCAHVTLKLFFFSKYIFCVLDCQSKNLNHPVTEDTILGYCQSLKVSVLREASCTELVTASDTWHFRSDNHQRNLAFTKHYCWHLLKITTLLSVTHSENVHFPHP